MKKTYLEAGKLVSTHGVRGELKLLPWTDSAAFLLPFRTFYLPAEQPLRVKSSRVQKTCLLIQFEGIDTVEDAAALVGRVLSFRRDDPCLDPDTVFLADLVGLPVRSEGREIGRITEVLPMPSSDVYVVKGEHEYLIPAVKAFVPTVDPSLGYVEVHLIEGMQTDAD